jgi:hypothetical protein
MSIHLLSVGRRVCRRRRGQEHEHQRERRTSTSTPRMCSAFGLSLHNKATPVAIKIKNNFYDDMPAIGMTKIKCRICWRSL